MIKRELYCGIHCPLCIMPTRLANLKVWSQLQLSPVIEYISLANYAFTSPYLDIKLSIIWSLLILLSEHWRKEGGEADKPCVARVKIISDRSCVNPHSCNSINGIHGLLWITDKILASQVVILTTSKIGNNHSQNSSILVQTLWGIAKAEPRWSHLVARTN